MIAYVKGGTMDNKKYEAMIHIAENHSITKTAEEMGYTQSGVTQMINSLEDELGLKLLVRTNKGVALTTAGDTLLHYMREEHKWEAMIRQEADLMQGLETGTVMAGCLSSVSAAWMPSILEHFARQHPKIKVHMLENETPELLKMLADGRIDIAITDIATDRKEFSFTELVHDEIMAVVPLRHPLSTRKNVSLEELRQFPFVSYATGDTGSTNIGWPDIATGHKIKWEVMYSCKDDMTAINMVEHNLGVTLAGSLMLGNYPVKTANISLDPPLFRSLGITLRAHEDMLPATKSFIDCAHEIISPNGKL